MSTKNEVIKFLNLMVSAIQMNKLNFVPRRVNTDFLREIGWNYRTLISYLEDNLCEDDYIKGPESDHNGEAGEIWVFGKSIENKEVYIKIKIISDDCKCLSFHEATSPLNYHFK